MNCTKELNAIMLLNQAVYRESNLVEIIGVYQIWDVKLFQNDLNQIDILTNIRVHNKDIFLYEVRNENSIITINLYQVNNCFYYSQSFSFNKAIPESQSIEKLIKAKYPKAS